MDKWTNGLDKKKVKIKMAANNKQKKQNGTIQPVGGMLIQNGGF